MEAPPDSPPGPAPGAGGVGSRHVPDHELIRIIGKGSYGEVWLARNALGAYRAVKIVHQSTFRDKRPFDREFNGVQNFEPVSRSHEGLMEVLQAGRDAEGGYFYCVMELADDVALGQAIDPANYVPRTLAREVAGNRRLPIETCLRVGTAIASALAFLHSRGLVHRDIKPSNIVFINGVPKLGDIGLVAEMSEARSYVGTEGFIPPEGPGTAQADIYSLGKVLYEITTGKDRHDYPELPSLLDQTVHSRELLELNKMILKACRAEPRQRYQSAQEMAADLLALQGGEPVSVHRARRHLKKTGRHVAVAAAGVLVLFGAVRLVNWAAGHPKPAHAPPGLVAWWRGEGNAGDSAGTNAGVLVNSAGFAVAKVGRGFLLDGKSGFIYVPASASLEVGQGEGLSIEAWIKPMDVAFGHPILEWNRDGGSGIFGTHFWVYLGSGGPGSFGANLVDVEGNWHVISAAAGSLLTNTFQHIALTYDKESGKGRLFLNGRAVKVTTWGSFTPETSYDLYIGHRPPGTNGTGFFMGTMDEISLYNRALTTNEVRAVYNAGGAGKHLARKPRAEP